MIDPRKGTSSENYNKHKSAEILDILVFLGL